MAVGISGLTSAEEVIGLPGLRWCGRRSRASAPKAVDAFVTISRRSRAALAGGAHGAEGDGAQRRVEIAEAVMIEALLLPSSR